MKKTINAQIVADSISPLGYRITTYLLTYPRFIHAELMTHRMFSRNSASSRAIPFEKMLKMVEEDPFIPIAWQKDHKGMQGTEYITEPGKISMERKDWLTDRDAAVKGALAKSQRGITKQLCNRLLEPFMWHTVLVTATEYDNFFELRCPKLYHASNGKYYKSLKDWNKIDSEIQWNGLTCLHPENKSQAEIHIQTLAESMWDAMNESIPKKLQPGEWHIPFGDRIVEDDLLPILYKVNAAPGEMAFQKVKIATARCARLSYMTFDGEIDYEKDINLHDHLLKSHHMSPFEHCARVMTEEEYFNFYKGDYRYKYTDEEQYKKSFGWSNNFKGFISYRYLIENNEL